MIFRRTDEGSDGNLYRFVFCLKCNLPLESPDLDLAKCILEQHARVVEIVNDVILGD